MTVTADAPFHPRGCMTICQSDTPCLCIRAFQISRQVGFDKTHLWLRYHKAPAANTSIASGLLGIERRGRPLFLIILKGSRGHNLYPSLAERFFSYPTQYLSLIENGFLICHCSHFFEFWWAILSYFWLRSILRGFGLVLVWDKSSSFTCMWILVVHTGSCSHSNENCALRCDLRESSKALIKKYWLFLPRF